jgi:hypothetical protein
LYDRLGSRHDAALLRLLRTPAPDLGALAEKIERLVDQQAWEFGEGESCVASLVRDARRFAAAAG